VSSPNSTSLKIAPGASQPVGLEYCDGEVKESICCSVAPKCLAILKEFKEYDDVHLLRARVDQVGLEPLPTVRGWTQISVSDGGDGVTRGDDRLSTKTWWQDEDPR
jgi:hypothetical protein